MKADPAADPPFRVILLVGFMASGKTSVGKGLAERLGWTFADADAEVEARTGRSVAELFAERGEAGFREVEARVTAELLGRSRLVLASGGGWPAGGPGRLEALPADVLTVWLRVSPPVAVERARIEGRARPLLDVPDPEARARELLERRDPVYARAGLHLDASGPSPRTLVSAIVDYLDDVVEGG